MPTVVKAQNSIIGALCSKLNFGYIVFCLKDYSKYVYYIEKYGSKLNSVLRKYINDQKIRFANKELQQLKAE